jgi:isoleucyl-tRNA synthetase
MSISFPKTEEEVLARWREIEAFQTQLRLTENKERFTFYDGPPFGTVHLLVLSMGSPEIYKY